MTQCMSRASVPVHEGWEVRDAATSSTGLGTRKAVAPLPGALRSPPLAGPPSPCPLFPKPKFFRWNFPGDSAQGTMPHTGPTTLNNTQAGLLAQTWSDQPGPVRPSQTWPHWLLGVVKATEVQRQIFTSPPSIRL